MSGDTMSAAEGGGGGLLVTYAAEVRIVTLKESDETDRYCKTSYDPDRSHSQTVKHISHGKAHEDGFINREVRVQPVPA